ncbi:S1-C subfamily serine protease [Salirhabdus euzebyi]|uniref:S1-C subfamily serine protease n=1 Tax=Salirhabdus euzebyi TaxID=394506 RepID=A0A841PVQ6_9BACI|nr:serine protease [Salirhabdus euzebyi]MBB6451824.1 S1-C subfamily serine protease [Salirhabdus euzebyi]
MDDEKKIPETIDETDLYEDIEEEEMYDIIQEERKKIRHKVQDEEKPKRPFPKWVFWLIAIFMLLNVVSMLPSSFSLPVIDFLKTSAKLSALEEIDDYQESVVVVETGDGKGTGFSISPDGYILTNHHVIDSGTYLGVAFPDHGLFEAEKIAEYPELDLALLKVEGEDLPYLSLAPSTSFEPNEHIYFIGNPLNFNGIANEGEVLGYTNSSGIEGDVLMLKAPVYRGNSGSPVINSDGEVIAVVYATGRRDGVGKVGLAIPISYFHEKEESMLIEISKE